MPKLHKRNCRRLTREGQRLTSAGVDVGDIADVVHMLKGWHRISSPDALVYPDEPGKKFTSPVAHVSHRICGSMRLRSQPNNMKMLEGALEKLILLLKEQNEDRLPWRIPRVNQNITSSEER